MHALYTSQVANKSSFIVLQLLSIVGIDTYYYCLYIVVADYYTRWLGTTYHAEFTVISNRQATCKFNARTVHYYQKVQCAHIIIIM
jgi:hypothetical protein